MIVAFPLHIVAMVVWLGGLVVLTTVAPRLADEQRALWWHRSLERFVVLGSVALGIILFTGIALVQLRFGGFSNVPALHRWNMLLGLPAIALHAHAHFVHWPALRRAVDARDWRDAERRASTVSARFAVIATLGMSAAIVSLVGRVVGV
jgi:uncharacterized membrane protein